MTTSILLPLPDFGNGSKGGMGSWNWAVSSGADGIPNSGDEVDLDAAYAFIDYATQQESIERFVDGYGAVPPIKDLSAFPASSQTVTARCTSTISRTRTPIRACSRPARWHDPRPRPTCSSAIGGRRHSPTSSPARTSSPRWTTSPSRSIMEIEDVGY